MWRLSYVEFWVLSLPIFLSDNTAIRWWEAASLYFHLLRLRRGALKGLAKAGQYRPFGVSFYLLKLWGRGSSIKAQ